MNASSNHYINEFYLMIHLSIRRKGEADRFALNISVLSILSDASLQFQELAGKYTQSDCQKRVPAAKQDRRP